MTRDEALRKAVVGATDVVASLRRSNAAFEKETGEPSTVSEADYLKCYHDLVEQFMKIWEASRHPSLRP